MCGRGPGSSTSRSSPTGSPDASSAGKPRDPSRPTWPSTRSSKPSGHANETAQISTNSSITPTEECNILSIRYTERLAEDGVVNSVGSRGDSYDNALAETINGLYKTELVRNQGPWRGLDDLEIATLEWVDWFNHRRLFHDLGSVPPAEFEDLYYRQEVTAHKAETQTTEPA